MQLLLALTYVVYIPVSILDSSAPLLMLDCCLGAAILATLTGRERRASVFGGHELIQATVVFFVASVLFALVRETNSLDSRTLIDAHNACFGLVVFALSSAILRRSEDIHGMLRIALWGSVLTALNGFRQLVFGFAPFELERLATKGRALAELEIFGRQRLTSTFGDPLAFGVFMMFGVFVYIWMYVRDGIRPPLAAVHPMGFALIAGALLGTLTRAPMLGTACGLGTVAALGVLWNRPRWWRPMGMVALSGGLLVGAASWFVRATDHQSESKATSVAFHVAATVESFEKMVTNQEGEGRLGFLAQGSKDSRIESWGIGLRYILENPLGAGFSRQDDFAFSWGDVGLLKVGLQLGAPGLAAMTLILLFIPLNAVVTLRRYEGGRSRREVLVALGFWVGVVVTNGVTSILDNAAMSVPAWVCAGLLVNNSFLLLGEVPPIQQRRGTASGRQATRLVRGQETP